MSGHRRNTGSFDFIDIPPRESSSPPTEKNDKDKSRKRASTGISLFRSVNQDVVKKYMKTVAKGDLTTIRKYVNGKKDISVATVDKLGRNAIHIAALHSQEKTVRLLLELGVDPVHCDGQRWTPLHTACSVGHCDIAELLLSVYESRHILCLFNFFFVSLTPNRYCLKY